MNTKPNVSALVIDAKDNVATALEPLDAHIDIQIATPTNAITIQPTEPIPLKAGDPIIKYGSPIGTMLTNAQPGTRIHTHNMRSLRC